MDIEPQPQRFKKTYTPNKVPPTCAALYKKIVLVKIHIYGKNHKRTDWETTMYSLVNMISLDWDFQWPSTSLWVDTIWKIWVAYTSHSISYLCTRLPTKIVVHTVNNIITTVENLFCLSLRMREREREREWEFDHVMVHPRLYSTERKGETNTEEMMLVKWKSLPD